MSEKLDRRKKYTRKVLKESLIALLAKKPLSNITVKEICELADINRSTFYTHYADQYDLLHKMEEEVTEDMNNYLHNYTYSMGEESIQMTEKILEYITENSFMFHTLLNKDAIPTFEKRMMELARGFMIDNLMSDNNFKREESKYLSTFVISGAIHVIKDWIENDMDQSPKEMAVMINNFINEGLSNIN
ncbi:TetR/AcrR family transcriptional regulator [Sediminibacillus massiliensis]|uniref:TetR/AcrR family transcriptional regulator n=1 Tax=Sediminibacillus massiliensis TaxID=1926277 RepID=UPI000988386B|nr:TetR-like C-terminal domain-containing protein [Sediminibacillus massiliensis]